MNPFRPRAPPFKVAPRSLPRSHGAPAVPEEPPPQSFSPIFSPESRLPAPRSRVRLGSRHDSLSRTARVRRAPRSPRLAPVPDLGLKGLIDGEANGCGALERRGPPVAGLQAPATRGPGAPHCDRADVWVSILPDRPPQSLLDCRVRCLLSILHPRARRWAVSHLQWAESKTNRQVGHDTSDGDRQTNRYADNYPCARTVTGDTLKRL